MGFAGHAQLHQTLRVDQQTLRVDQRAPQPFLVVQQQVRALADRK
jgi:hypothetical protein